MSGGFELRVLDSLAKVYADGPTPRAATLRRASCLRGEVFSFQAAYRAEGLLKGLEVRVDSPLAGCVEVRRVGLVPAELTGTAFDDDVERTAPGLFPDPLLPLDEDFVAFPGQWRSVWVTVRVPARAPAGKQRLSLEFRRGSETLKRAAIELEVIDALLPRQKLMHTSWFHVDCIATQYGVEVWSRRHWTLLERFMASAAGYGVNLLLTPLFTPPLDTRVGGERPTVQLVDVTRRKGKYSFGFARLKRWVEAARRNGIDFFEMSHLFTQWGAAHPPKIVADDEGRRRRIFGWRDAAAGPEYRAFLQAFMPALLRFIEREGLKRRCYFHVSDEPHSGHLENFTAAAEILRPYVRGFPVIDALSDPEYYRRGLVRRPVVASDHMGPFRDLGIKDLWTYYCCSQWKGVSNRFFSMPAARNRVLGLQLYRLGLSGFLHWGFNFWYRQYSTGAIDPWRVTDAGHAFPAGDAYLVYPGPEGPIGSLRAEVFYEGLQDMRALQLLEKVRGRKRAVALLERGLERPLDMTEYPRGSAWLLQARQRVTRALASALKD